jgi:hypothetical protein
VATVPASARHRNPFTLGMRRFVLVRRVDVTGVSGTGVVAEGCRFTDGTVALRWRTDKASTVLWNNLDDLVTVHCHGGTTFVDWLDLPD